MSKIFRDWRKSIKPSLFRRLSHSSPSVVTFMHRLLLEFMFCLLFPALYLWPWCSPSGFITTTFWFTFSLHWLFWDCCTSISMIGFFLIKWKTFLLHVELKSWHFWATWDLRKLLSIPTIFVRGNTGPQRQGGLQDCFCLTANNKVPAQPPVSSAYRWASQWVVLVSSVKRQFQCLLEAL